ncbi:hypothetical protein DOY81_011324 [Sarcophaga bullata]|nr:hypothetical protein DOY81_011324 [Sarcophaga bullata]
MDPFTQRMLEKAEERSRALGVSNASASKFPLRNDDGSANTEALSGSCEKAMAISSQQKTRKQQLPIASGRENINKLQVIEKHNKETDSSQTPQKVLRQFSAVDKENMDLGIEISILTDKNVEVQVQVEEENDVATDKENETKGIKNSQQFDRPIVKIRDTSRNQLQRLGALYSNKADLSSPIHRTEGQFHAEEIESNQEIHRRMPKQRLGKLAALANTINQWEDDTSHRILEVSSKTENQSDSQKPVDNKAKPCDSNLSQDVKRVSSKSNDQIRREHATDNKAKSSESNLSKETRLENKSKTNKEEIKQLKWDPKVLNSLEAQGFQRRESSTVKVSYEFAEKNNDTEPILNTEKEKREKVEKPVIGKLNTPKLTPASSNSATESKTNQMDKNKPIIKTGLVSGRAAMFETQANSKQQSQHQKLEKDPTELSLKERMKLFEKNKGEALVPKAAFGMAPPLNKITHDSNTRREDKAKATSESSRSNTTNAHNPTATTPIVRAVMESKVRDKVNALINAACENHIKEDIKRQREEDLPVTCKSYMESEEEGSSVDVQ